MSKGAGFIDLYLSHIYKNPGDMIQDKFLLCKHWKYFSVLMTFLVRFPQPRPYDRVRTATLTVSLAFMADLLHQPQQAGHSACVTPKKKKVGNSWDRLIL